MADSNDSSDSQTVTFATPLPHTLDTQIHVRLTTRAKSLMLFVTTAGTEDAAGSLSPLGSLVYAVPDRFNPGAPLCTNLYVEENSLEFATRLARLVAKKTQLPAYVSSSLSLERMGLGGTVEEVLEAFRAVTGTFLYGKEAARARFGQLPLSMNGHLDGSTGTQKVSTDVDDSKYYRKQQPLPEIIFLGTTTSP
ncbi:hypothetical protein SPI_03144 [Niveomyces insectorum RCEF 264]|uniref:Uncharacterized protein n=1 Tax=Niveomyces insectorum RCEF 264 TaxID=1081102 RepID=A0A167X3W0_9HYPO|nr:hypothetical protein SPI_03144 [Niveomyces insectorum RCEF 264]